MPFRPEYRDGGRTIPETTPPRDGQGVDGSAHRAGSPQPPGEDSTVASEALQSALPTLLTFSSFLEELRSKKVELARQGVSEAQIRSMVLQFIADRGLAISGASGIAIALAEGNDVVCRGSAGESAPPTYPGGLSLREIEVLRLVANGLTNAQVAERLFLSPRTVNAHLTTIYTKLNVPSRAGAIRFPIVPGGRAFPSAPASLSSCPRRGRPCRDRAPESIW